MCCVLTIIWSIVSHGWCLKWVFYMNFASTDDQQMLLLFWKALWSWHICWCSKVHGRIFVKFSAGHFWSRFKACGDNLTPLYLHLSWLHYDLYRNHLFNILLAVRINRDDPLQSLAAILKLASGCYLDECPLSTRANKQTIIIPRRRKRRLKSTILVFFCFKGSCWLKMMYSIYGIHLL